MTNKIIIKTDIATEYTSLNKIFSSYAMIIRKRFSEYKDDILMPTSESFIVLEIDDTQILNCFLNDLQKIEDVEVKIE